ncbi:DNA-3-methyladenine glycosylase I [Mesonia phycicola]|uniref:DNA-3-methyladenine glycosylase I n=1 Tax=Mesonia phycicola TaxID=579105 RepID=A0A1M6HFR8_9FLAO|nr:DNA-3-methyladenine glycosylase I [Mesonia phycicola]SHJ21027.1 DNA-3-methyladenine glycosylase I [Mesonia phycicola]
MSKERCDWCKGDKLYEAYHDKEWGVPVYDDATIFEFLMLETFQAGLSWITILKKRENFRKAFDDFDYQKIANYSDKKTESLLQDSGIIRNKLKIKSAISNAKLFIEVQKEFGSFSNYLWAYVNHKPIDNKINPTKGTPATSLISEKISKDLKKRGFKFVGPTVIYAHMQATGMVNDHITTCFRYEEVKLTS